MKDREKILRYFAATGEEAKEMAIRLLDIADTVDRGRPFAVGPFMSPFAAQVGQTVRQSGSVSPFSVMTTKDLSISE